MSGKEKERPKVSAMSEVEPEFSEKELTELLKKVDKESTFRNLTGNQYQIVFWVAVAFSCFQLYTATFGLFAAQLQRSIHLAFAFVLVYMLYPFRVKGASDTLKWSYNYLFAAFAGFVGLYLTLNYTRIMEAGGDYSQR